MIQHQRDDISCIGFYKCFAAETETDLQQSKFSEFLKHESSIYFSFSERKSHSQSDAVTQTQEGTLQ